MKKTLLLFLILFCLMTLCVTPTQANETYSNFDDYLVEQVLNGTESIDVRTLNLTKDEAFDLIDKFAWEHPEISFCITSKGTTSANNQVITLELRYDDKSTIRSRAEFINEELDNIARYINPDWTDLQKTLWINDYICDNFKYDIVSAYSSLDDFLTSGVGICEAYTNLFTALCHKVGIPVSYAYSNEINHIWNVVYIDGEWYHVDTTWNDNYTSRYDQFLISENQKVNDIIKSELAPSAQIVSPHSATSTKYNQAFWRNNIYSSFVHDEYASYYVSDGGLYRVNLNSMSPIMLTILTSDRWYAAKNQYYTQRFVDIEDGGDYLYFNTPTDIYRINKTTFQQEKIASITDNSQIYSLRFQDDILLIGTNTDIERDFIDFVKRSISDVYKVSFIVHDTTVYQAYYTYGSKVTPPTNISVPGYQFISWDNVPNTVVGDCSVWANIEDKTKPITIRFMVDGELYYEYQGMYGEQIKLPDNPVKASDKTHNYYFMNWDLYEIGMTISQDVTFNARFQQESKVVQLRFYQNGTLISNLNIYAGSEIPFPSCPKTIVSNGKNLVFVGWDTDELIAYDNLDINAVYAEQNKMCSVKYYVAGELVHEEKVVAGTELVNLQNFSLNDESYVLNGWVSNCTSKYVIDDVRFDAVIEPTAKQNPGINILTVIAILGAISLLGGILIIVSTKSKRS